MKMEFVIREISDTFQTKVQKSGILRDISRLQKVHAREPEWLATTLKS